MPRYGRRKLVAVPSHRRMPAKPEWIRQEIIKLMDKGDATLYLNLERSV